MCKRDIAQHFVSCAIKLQFFVSNFNAIRQPLCFLFLGRVKYSEEGLSGYLSGDTFKLLQRGGTIKKKKYILETKLEKKVWLYKCVLVGQKRLG